MPTNVMSVLSKQLLSAIRSVAGDKFGFQQDSKVWGVLQKRMYHTPILDLDLILLQLS